MRSFRSSKLDRLYDPIRNRYVAATPEEFVRQSLLRQMIQQLSYPKGLIAVEKQLGDYQRRFDLVCYANGPSGLFPLLVVECKAQDCLQDAREQVLGYNATIGAPFLCIASKTQIHTLWLNGDQIASVPFLPPYRDLVEMAQKRLNHEH